MGSGNQTKLFHEFRSNLKKHQVITKNKYKSKYPTISGKIIDFFIEKCVARIVTLIGCKNPKEKVDLVLVGLNAGEITGNENTGYAKDFFIVLSYGEDAAVKKLIERETPDVSRELEDGNLMVQLRLFLNELIDGEVVDVLNEYLSKFEEPSLDKKVKISSAEVRKVSPSVEVPDEGHKKPRLG